MNRPLTLRRVLPVGFLLASLGCSGGLNCGSGCANDYVYGTTAASVPNGVRGVDDGVRMRLSQGGLDFLRENLAGILTTQFPTVPGRPGVIAIELPPTQLAGDFSTGIGLGEGPEEVYPTKLLLDVSDFATNLTLEFVDAGNGIRMAVRDLPVGIDARVFAQLDLGIGSPNAACQLVGTNCPGNDPDCGVITELSFSMLISPRVGRGAECDETGGIGECLKVDVELENFDLGDIGAGSLEIELPPNTGNLSLSISDQQGCDRGDAPANCSPTCSDRVAFDPTGANDECETLCATVDFLSDIILSIGGAILTLLDPLLEPILEQAIIGALEDVDGAPIAASGRFDIAAAAPGVLPESALDLGFSIAPTGNAFDVNGAGTALGMDMILKSGFEAAPPLDANDGSSVPHPCVRPIEGAEFATLFGDGVRGEFEAANVEALTGTFNGAPYHLGASLAKPALNQVMFSLYNTGALCLEINSDAVNNLTGGAFQLTAATLDLLTQGKLKQFADANAPAIIALSPSQPPVITYGAGTVEEGHIKVSWPDVEISFYVLMFERFSRIFAVSTDISLELAVFNDPATETLQISVVNGPTIDGFVENYNELLPGVNFQEVLESLIGVVFDAALGDEGLQFEYDVGSALGDALGVPIFIDFQGIETVPVTDREFLNIYLSMTSTPPQPQTVSPTSMRLANEPGLLRLPEAEDVRHVDRATLPTGEVHVDVDDGDNREFFVRIDFGAWRGPLRAHQGEIIVRDGKLALAGEHTLYVRSRGIGDPNSLEPAEEAARLTLWVDPSPPTVELQVNGDIVTAVGDDNVTPFNQLVYSWQVGDNDASDFDDEATLDLDDVNVKEGSRIVVRARDLAGNISRAAVIDSKVAKLRLKDQREADDSLLGGCAATPASTTWLLALAGLAFFTRRLRIRRS